MRQRRELLSAGTAGHRALSGENSRARSTAGSFPHVQRGRHSLERHRVIPVSAGVTAERGPGCSLAGAWRGRGQVSRKDNVPGDI